MTVYIGLQHSGNYAYTTLLTKKNQEDLSAFDKEPKNSPETF